MTEPPKKTRSSALAQIKPPPISQHLREFASNHHAWAVLARNLIPVIGIYFFGWSVALSVFSYWFDGLTALAAIISAVIPRALRESKQGSDNLFKMMIGGVITWIFLIFILGLPYWIVLIPLHALF